MTHDRSEELHKKYVQAQAEVAAVKKAAQNAYVQTGLMLQGLENKITRLEALTVKLMREQGKTDEEIIAFAALPENAGLFSLRLVDDKDDAFGAKLK